MELGNVFEMLGQLEDVEDFGDVMDWYLNIPLFWEIAIACGLAGVFILCVVFIKNLLLG